MEKDVGDGRDLEILLDLELRVEVRDGTGAWTT
jgi:hypothetical protein